MAVNNRVYTYTDSDGRKHEVPMVWVSSLGELQRGDHIAFCRHSGAYWHHAIVEHIDTEKSKVIVIEYSNTAKGFSEDNSIPPKRPGLAKVVRGEYQFQIVYLIKYKQCLDQDSVVWRARSKLGERKYNLFSNNCEQFATWCKTGTSSSQQVIKFKEELGEKAKREIARIGGAWG